jgi:hypothetical protein
MGNYVKKKNPSKKELLRRRRISEAMLKIGSPLSDPEVNARKKETAKRTKALGLWKKREIPKEVSRERSKKMTENQPMHNEKLLKKKVKTFKENFDKETSRLYSAVTKKRWERRKMSKNALRKLGEEKLPRPVYKRENDYCGVVTE